MKGDMIAKLVDYYIVLNEYPVLYLIDKNKAKDFTNSSEALIYSLYPPDFLAMSPIFAKRGAGSELSEVRLE